MVYVGFVSCRRSSTVRDEVSCIYVLSGCLVVSCLCSVVGKISVGSGEVEPGSIA